MIISRLISIIFRAAEFICSAIVLGLTAFLIHRIRDTSDRRGFRRRDVDVPNRIIYTIVVSVLSVIISVIFFIPFTATFHWPLDFIFSALWFAAFGLLVDANDASCGGPFEWRRIGTSACGRWRAMQAFTFLAAVFFFASFLLSLWVSRKNRKETVVTTKRSRFGRRTAV